MNVLQAGLTNNVVSVYDKTKTTVFGRAFLKTISATSVIGPPLTNFIDSFTDAAITGNMVYCTPNNRLFIITAITAGVATVALYNFDLTGVTAPSYVGKILINYPNTAATTHTLRHFKVYDGVNQAAVTGWQILVGTSASVLINGGNFVAQNIALSDFIPISSPTIGMAIASNAKANYFLQDPGNIGVANNLTQNLGASIDFANRLWITHNGLAATNQFIFWDLSQTPTFTIQTTTAPTVNASPTFTLTAHGYAANDPVILLTNVPTPFAASTSTAQTVYFVRNPTANTFALSATSGGASINATSVTASTTIGRAFGTSTTMWNSRKTGNIAGISGTLLSNNSEKYSVPVDSINAGLPCIFFASTTNLYLVKISDLTNGATTPASLTTVNVLGTGIDYTAITNSSSTYSTDCGQAIFVSNSSTFYTKSWINSVINLAFGGLQTTWLEATMPPTTTFALVTLTCLETQQGWLFATGGTAGQRGVLYCDLRSDQSFNYSYVVSPVLLTSGAVFNFLNTIEKLFDYTNSMKFSYRTAATSGDATFNNPGGAWTVVDFASSLTAFALNTYAQFRIDFFIADFTTNTPAQVSELQIGLTPVNEISSNWEGSVDNTSSNGASPAYTAFRMTQAYASVVPTMYFRAYDDSGNLVASANTASNPSFFSYSTNNGSSWIALGTVPNTPFTTELRYAWVSPPGVRVTCSIRES